MTFAEFKNAYPGGYFLVAAEDIPGFYRKGHGMYGNCDSMVVAYWRYLPKVDAYEVFLKDGHE